MVNRLAGIMYTIYEEKWLQLELIYEHLKNYGAHWDQAEPDTEDLELIWNENLKLLKNNFR